MTRVSPLSQPRLAEWLLAAALLASYPASAVLPAPWSREGGPLENLQVLMLCAGCVLALGCYLRTRPLRLSLLALWSAPVWLLLAARELSWGRVLFPDGGHGGGFWFEPAVRPLAALVLAWLVFSACRYRIHEVLRSALARRVPWLCMGVALLAALGSTCAEGHMGCSLGLPAARAELVEELAELLAYVSLLVIQASVLFVPRTARLAVETTPA